MLLGVKYLHDNNIVHRDIKPENFLIDINNNKVTVKLTDFGLACYYDPQDPPSRFCGTLNLMAPEIH